MSSGETLPANAVVFVILPEGTINQISCNGVRDRVVGFVKRVLNDRGWGDPACVLLRTAKGHDQDLVINLTEMPEPASLEHAVLEGIRSILKEAASKDKGDLKKGVRTGVSAPTA